MGFSTIGAGIVLFIGFLFVASSVLSASFDGQRSVMDAARDDRDRERFDRETDAQVDSCSQPGSNFSLTLTNTGGTPLDPHKVTVFFDGEWIDPGLFDREVDGQAKGVWAPGEQLELTKNHPPGQRPDRVFAVLETGRGFICMI